MYNILVEQYYGLLMKENNTPEDSSECTDLWNQSSVPKHIYRENEVERD